MDSALLAELWAQIAAVAVRADAALKQLDQLIAAAGRRCAACHRRSDDLAECADGQWRGPSCRKRYEASAGVQLPIGGEG